MLLLERHAAGGHADLLLDGVFAGTVAAPHGFDEAGLVVGDVLHFLHRGCFVGVRVTVCAGALKHVMLDGLQEFGKLCLDFVKGDNELLAGIAAHKNCLVVGKVLRADFDTNRNAAHLLLGELESGRLLGIVNLNANILGKTVTKRISSIENAFLLLLNRDDNGLHRSHKRRKNKAGVVAVNHDDGTDHTGRHAPAGLVRIYKFIFLIGILDAERSGKSVAEVMARTALQRLAVMHQRFNRIGGFRTGKFLLVGLASLYHRDRKEFLAEISVNIKHLLGSCLRLLGGSMNRMTFLPQKFHGAKERSRRLLPTYNRAPLVINLRQIAIGMHDMRIKIAEKRLGRRTHAHLLLQRLTAALGYPCNLGCEALNVIFLFIQKAFRNEHREIAVLHAGLFEAAVKLLLDVLPNRVARGSDDHAPLDAGIIHKLRFLDNVRIPLGEIVLHIGNGLNKIVCHLPFLLVCCPFGLRSTIYEWYCFSHKKSRKI